MDNKDLCIIPDTLHGWPFLMFLLPMADYSGLDCCHARSSLSPFLVFIVLCMSLSYVAIISTAFFKLKVIAVRMNSMFPFLSPV